MSHQNENSSGGVKGSSGDPKIFDLVFYVVINVMFLQLVPHLLNQFHHIL